jgi:tetratricopeptide (TPR) repeat protein
MEIPDYLHASLAYAAFGAAIGVTWRYSPRLRENGWVQFVAVALSLSTALPVLAVSAADEAYLTEFHLAMRGFFFLGAAVCHLPVLIHVAVLQGARLVERMTSASRGTAPPPPETSPREVWEGARRLLEALAADPLDHRIREALALKYLTLGCVDSAVREYRKAVECAERGYDHARLLYKAAWLLVETKRTTAPALSLLRALVRLYPKSYFAAYARRVISQYEAHEGASLLGGANGCGWPSLGAPPREREARDREAGLDGGEVADS